MALSVGTACSTCEMPEVGHGMAMGGDARRHMPMMQQFRTSTSTASSAAWSWRASRRSSARYFGATEGVLRGPGAGERRVQARGRRRASRPSMAASPDDGTHALRILRSYKSGEKLNITGAAPAQAADARGRPCRSARSCGDNFMFESMTPPMPAMPAMPAVPPAPPAAGARQARRSRHARLT